MDLIEALVRTFCFQYAECSFSEGHHAECHYAECYYAECYYAECCGAVLMDLADKHKNPGTDHKPFN
jgi:hypothetical protein